MVTKYFLKTVRVLRVLCKLLQKFHQPKQNFKLFEIFCYFYHQDGEILLKVAVNATHFSLMWGLLHNF